MANLKEVERLLCERYNVRVLDGPLKEAIEAGDVAVLTVLIADRDMYRWHGPIQSALRRAAVVEAEPEEEEPAGEATDESGEDEAEEAAEPEEEEPESNRSSRSRRR